MILVKRIPLYKTLFVNLYNITINWDSWCSRIIFQDPHIYDKLLLALVKKNLFSKNAYWIPLMTAICRIYTSSFPHCGKKMNERNSLFSFTFRCIFSILLYQIMDFRREWRNNLYIKWSKVVYPNTNDEKQRIIEFVTAYNTIHFLKKAYIIFSRCFIFLSEIWILGRYAVPRR